MVVPGRVQMRRDRPWRRDHPDAVIVARPSKWGNPFRVGYQGIRCRSDAVWAFETWLHDSFAGKQMMLEARQELRGRDLACWCPLGVPCHADVLLRYANPERAERDTAF